MDSDVVRTGGSKVLARLLAAATPLLLATVAAAQSSGPRNPRLDTAPSPVIGYAILAILGLAILAISLYPSKRSHTDL